MLILVGAFFLGFDLKQAVKEIKDTQKESQAIYQQIKASSDEVAEMKREVELIMEKAKTHFSELQETSKKAQLIVVSLGKQYNSISKTTVTTVNASSTRINSSLSRRGKSKLWANGSTLRVKFMGGSKILKEKIVHFANQWIENTSLTLKFGQWEKSEFRISFNENEGTWSYVGTGALDVAQKSPTMNFGWLNIKSTDEEIALTILPQFGHALGLYNEHQNTNASINWDKNKIEKELSSAPYFWSQEQINHQFYKKWTPDTFPIEKKFDSDSVMFSEHIRKYVLDDFSNRKKTSLSLGDKEFIKRLYPITASQGGSVYLYNEFQKVLSLWGRDDKIKLIKWVRGKTGLGLKESKEYVESNQK